MDGHLRQSLSRFRCSNHRLEVECGRHAKPESVPRRDRICRLCSQGAVEDEDHLLLVCPAHHDIRCKFSQQLGKQLTPCSLLPELMHSANQKAVALYLVSCLDNRSVLLCNCRQMDLSGPGIDIKLKERKKDLLCPAAGKHRFRGRSLSNIDIIKIVIIIKDLREKPH